MVIFKLGKDHSKWRDRIAKFREIEGTACSRNRKEASVAECENARSAGEEAKSPIFMVIRTFPTLPLPCYR